MESIIKKLGKTSVTVEKDYHSSEKEYNKLTIVEEKDTFKTYLSRKPVPVGIALTNREYWICFSGVLESITFDYLKFKKDYASGKAIEDNAIITRHILDRNIERIKIALKAISEEEIDDNAIIERTIKDRNITSNKIAKENILTEHFAKKSVITSILADYIITAIKLADNSVTTRSIADENITDIKLANNAVTTRSIAQESIIEEKFANNSVSTRSLIDKSITKEKLAENSVTESKIADNNITNRKIANNTIDITKFDSYTRNIIESVRYIPEEFTSLKEAIFDEINKYKPIIINGDVTNAADEEDITSENNLLKLKDRSSINGMGYVILRKNKSFAEQVTRKNTIYEIRYDFDLNGAEITIPKDCTLKFEGGSLNNGKITFLDTFLTGSIKIDCLCFGKVINNNSNVNWFCPKADGISDDTSAFQSAINICDNIYVPKGTYTVCLQRRGAKTPNGIYINRSNVHLIMDTEAVIKGEVSKEVTKPSNGYTGYNNYFGHVIAVQSDNGNEFINNITIEGGILIGVRDEFAEPIGSATEENQCGISVNFTNNCIIKNCIIKDNQGDAIIVYNSTNISIINTECINSRRTGISIGPCKNFLIESCKFINNGCDTLYNENIKYATGPQAGICFEGDTSSTIVEKKFNNVIIQNCYCEYDSFLTPPSNYVFVARNPPAFVFIGNLANGSDKIIVRNCEIKNINVASSSAFQISSNNTKCNNLYFIKNTYQSLVDIHANASMFLLVSSDIDNVLIDNNTCTTNTRMVFIYEGKGKFGNITVCNNKTLKVDGEQCAFYNFLRGKVDNLSICYNYANGIIDDNITLVELNECSIMNNYFEINSPHSGNAIVRIKAPNTATLRFINNIYKIEVPLDYTFYLFAIQPTYLDDDNNIVESSVATKLGGPHLDFVNNTVSVKGSKNILFSIYPNYISGLIANNIIKVSDATSLQYEAPSKPLSKELYIHNNIFDIRGNKTKGNIITASIENVFNFDNIYLGNKTFGDTLNTPKKLGIEDTGYPYYDKSLNYPIWWNGTNWVDSEGNKASKNRGTTAERPILNSTNEGFEYYDTTLKKKILWNGTEWTNIDGTSLE